MAKINKKYKMYQKVNSINGLSALKIASIMTYINTPLDFF